MAKRKSAYNNEYTRQIEEAVFDQHGYDNRKAEQKKAVQKENIRQRGLIRVFYFLCLLFVAVISYLIISAHGEMAAPLVVFLTGCAGVYFFVRWLNKG